MCMLFRARCMCTETRGIFNVHAAQHTHVKWYVPVPRVPLHHQLAYLLEAVCILGQSSSQQKQRNNNNKQETLDARCRESRNLRMALRHWTNWSMDDAHHRQTRERERIKDDVCIHNCARLKSICEIWYCSGLNWRLTDDDGGDADAAAASAVVRCSFLFNLLSSYFAFIRSHRSPSLSQTIVFQSAFKPIEYATAAAAAALIYE